MNWLRRVVMLAAVIVTVFSAIATAQEPRAATAKDIVIGDFEGPDYGPWKTTGEAFGGGPRRGDIGLWPYQGEKIASSSNGGDQSVGTLTSPDFKVERRYVTFLISGGNHPGETCINLLVDGKVVRTATAPTTNGCAATCGTSPNSPARRARRDRG